MVCEYGYYKDEETYYPKLYCGITNTFCTHSKKCEKEQKFIPTNNQDDCNLMKEHKKKNIPVGSYYVKMKDKGFLYVELDNNRIVKIKDTLGNVDNFVYVQKVGETYQISLIPFIKDN